MVADACLRLGGVQQAWVCILMRKGVHGEYHDKNDVEEEEEERTGERRWVKEK